MFFIVVGQDVAAVLEQPRNLAIISAILILSMSLVLILAVYFLIKYLVKPIDALNHPFFQEIDTASSKTDGSSQQSKAVSSGTTQQKDVGGGEDDTSMTSPSESNKVTDTGNTAENVKRDACTQTPII